MKKQARLRFIKQPNNSYRLAKPIHTTKDIYMAYMIPVNMNDWYMILTSLATGDIVVIMAHQDITVLKQLLKRKLIELGVVFADEVRGALK